MLKSLKEKLLSSKLYCITQPPPAGGTYVGIVEQACKGGADIIQLREKNSSLKVLVGLAKEIREVCFRYGALFIVNDFVDVALESGADGVHLGQEDIPLSEAKKKVGGRSFLIGRSSHSLEQALSAEKEGADYVGCGPLFATPTKPGKQAVGLELVKKYAQSLQIPFVAIGGIDLENVETVVRAGAKRVAVVRAVFGSPNIEEAARSLKNKVSVNEYK